MHNYAAINSGIVLISGVGLILSLYAYFVEINVENDRNYEALCDINEHMSCTKAFSSPYGKGFGIIGQLLGKKHFLNQPNSLYGVVFYPLFMILANYNTRISTLISLILGSLACVSSVYFAYILYFILRDFCIVCVSTYIVNIANFCFTFVKFRHVRKQQQQQQQQKEPKTTKKPEVAAEEPKEPEKEKTN